MLPRPSLGAYFASRPLPLASTDSGSWNVFALPAAISLGLLVLETVFLAVRLPETRSWKGRPTASKEDRSGSEHHAEPINERLKRLNIIGWVHGIFLLFFSGVSPDRTGPDCDSDMGTRQSSL